MAHDLMQTDVDKFSYAGRGPAWHSKGTVLPDAKTMTELADAAGIKFRYELTPVFFEVETLTDTFHHQYVGRSVITRDGTVPLSIVSDDFEFNQPAETIQSLDAIIAAGQWKPETALALGQGETTAYCVALGDWSLEGNGPSDRCRDFLLVTDTVDGKHALQVCIVTERVVCRNTLRIALKTASVRLNLVHKAGHKNNYGKTVDIIVRSQNMVREALTALAKVQYTQDKLDKLFATVFDTTTITGETSQDNALRRRMVELQTDAQGFASRMVKDEGLAMTGWVAFNAVSETVEHGGNFAGKVGVHKSLLLGNGAAMATLTKAYDLVPRM